MRDIEQLTDVVYHYTSMATLLKIVATRQIWATNIRYLNDVQEMSHFMSEVRRRLPKFLKDNLDIEKDRFDYLSEAHQSSQRFSELPFVASFSRDDDSLPQWRSYCPNGNGVSIGFRTESLKRAYAGKKEKRHSRWDLTPIVSFDPIEYLKAGDDSAIDDWIDEASEAAEEMIEAASNDPEASFDPQESVKWCFERIASRVKNHAFESEHESRLIVSTSGFSHFVEYRPTRSTLVPFIPLHIPDPETLSMRPVPKYARRTPYFIESITVGPTPNASLSSDSVWGLFNKMSADVIVQSSKVPYRDL